MKSPSAHIAQQPADPFAGLAMLADRACMVFYGQVRRNARRIARIGLALLPLMVLLVGSCKIPETAGLQGGGTAPEQFRAALFPGSVRADAGYRPATGYVERARTYIKDAPESLKLLTGREVGWLFGHPRMTRRDADARIWQYRARTCIVDFYFYGADAAPVSYVDVRMKDAAPAASLPDGARAKCLGRIMDGTETSGT